MQVCNLLEGNLRIFVVCEILLLSYDILIAIVSLIQVAFGLNNLNVIADDSAPFCKAVSQSFAGLVWQLRRPYIWQVRYVVVLSFM